MAEVNGGSILTTQTRHRLLLDTARLLINVDLTRTGPETKLFLVKSTPHYWIAFPGGGTRTAERSIDQSITWTS